MALVWTKGRRARILMLKSPERGAANRKTSGADHADDDMPVLRSLRCALAGLNLESEKKKSQSQISQPTPPTLSNRGVGSIPRLQLVLQGPRAAFCWCYFGGAPAENIQPVQS
jgi:hypothetical protein